MRFLAVTVAALAAASAAALGLPARTVAAVAAGCPARSVEASAHQRTVAQKAFADDFARIRRYLLQPTTANQFRMYSRVDAALFQYYSYEGGVLNANRGSVSGNFTFQFKPGTHCFTSKTRTVSFQVVVRARFRSTNRHGMRFARTAVVEMRAPRITRYVDPVTR